MRVSHVKQVISELQCLITHVHKKVQQGIRILSKLTVHFQRQFLCTRMRGKGKFLSRNQVESLHGKSYLQLVLWQGITFIVRKNWDVTSSVITARVHNPYRLQSPNCLTRWVQKAFLARIQGLERWSLSLNDDTENFSVRTPHCNQRAYYFISVSSPTTCCYTNKVTI